MDFPQILRFAYERVLPWAAPPVIGAVIGYVTNDIAIRMLFRPLTEKRIFGLRLPFTPGIIPKRRHELAESIGRMVSRELITADAVRRQMASEGFRERLARNVDSLLGSLLDKPLGSLGRGGQEAIVASAERFLAEAMHSFFSSRSFIHGVRTLVTQAVRRVSGLKLAEALGSAPIAAFLSERLLPLLGAPENRRRLAQAVRGWLAERAGSGEKLADLVPGELTEALAVFAGSLLPSLLEALFAWLEKEETRAELHARGTNLLRDILDKLNLLQKFLVTAGQFDKRLEQKMPEIVDDALGSLREYAFQPETLDNLRRVLSEALAGWRGKPIGEVLGAVRSEALGELVERALRALEGGDLRRRLTAGLQKWLERQSGRSLGELLQGTLRLQEQELVEFISVKILTYLSRKEASQAIAAEVVGFSRRFLEEQQGQTVRQLLHIGAEQQARAGSFLTDRFMGLIDERLPALLESFDVKQLVVAKVNSLDVAQVEKLLLIVIAKELKWIDAFGAILGAIIGFAQLALRLLR